MRTEVDGGQFPAPAEACVSFLPTDPARLGVSCKRTACSARYYGELR